IAGQKRLGGVDHDDVVAAIHMWREGRLVLAAQAQRDDGSKAADDETFGVDQHPLLLDLGRFGRVGFHGRISPNKARRLAASPRGVKPKSQEISSFLYAVSEYRIRVGRFSAKGNPGRRPLAKLIGHGLPRDQAEKNEE